MTTTKAWAARSATSPLEPFPITRREPGPTDVVIDVAWCGVCHSDLHQARNEWSNTIYPCVPGHEIVGHVARVGRDVRRFRVGDRAAVGCMVDSCRECDSCRAGLENYCERTAIWTYNGTDPRGGTTYGGYSERIVVNEHFVLKLADTVDLASTAPLLCAGITTWSPLRHWKAGPGKTVGIVGLGGLGHMGVKLAHALGARVVLFTTSPGKAEDARRLGADEVVVSRDAAAMAAHRRRFDLIVDCVSADHDVNAYLDLLRVDGTLALVGAPEQPLPVKAFSLLMGRKSFSGSGIGGIAETQEMLDFCAANGIGADVETIRIEEVNDAYERLLRSDVKYRFVIDMTSLAQAA